MTRAIRWTSASCASSSTIDEAARGVADKTEIIKRETLHKGFGTFETVVFRRRRRDGAMAELRREILDTGDGAVILPYDRARGTIILIRQFRGVAFLQEGRETIVEACAGKLEGDDPLTRIRKETEEETGIRLTSEPRRLFDGYSSPGSFSERLTYFVAPYEPGDRVTAGGGLATEGEDIEVIETTLDAALALVASGEINDAKTLVLLYWAKAEGLMDREGDIEPR